MTVLNARQDDKSSATCTRQQMDSCGRDAEHADQLPKLSILREVLRAPSSLPLGPLSGTEPRARESSSKNDTGLSGLAASANHIQIRLVEPIHPQRSARQRSIPLQQWEGTVTEVDADSFGAILRNLTDRAGPDEFSTISFEDLNEEDKELVRPGAVFYWSVVYLIEPYGQRQTAMTIYFRRLPGWSGANLERARRAAESYRDIFSDGSSE